VNHKLYSLQNLTQLNCRKLKTYSSEPRAFRARRQPQTRPLIACKRPGTGGGLGAGAGLSQSLAGAPMATSLRGISSQPVGTASLQSVVSPLGSLGSLLVATFRLGPAERWLSCYVGRTFRLACWNPTAWSAACRVDRVTVWRLAQREARRLASSGRSTAGIKPGLAWC
jgi:hypothetical protein